VTPDQIIQELMRIRNESERGIGILSEAENKLLELELIAEKAEARALLAAEGTVVDRQAVAKLESAEERFEAGLAKIEVNRVKTKLKHLTESMMAVQTSARMVEIMWKQAGIESR
jgi:hypothetical protein